MTEWNDLIFDVKTCTECGPGPRAVFRGSTSAKILIVGQAPGRKEADEGKPFVGPAGEVLDAALASVGLKEEDVLITNPVFFWPRGPDDRQPTSDEIAHGRTHLDTIIELLSPKLIIPLGAVAAKIFVSKPWGITKLSGTLQDDNVFPIIHPAAILRNPTNRPLWEQSWRNLASVLRQSLPSRESAKLRMSEEPWGPEQGFVHLHVHTEFSKLDGHQTVDELVREARRKGFRSLALTDHGTLAGWIQFYKACREAGIKPILGVEAYVGETRNAREYMHLTILAENLAGYHDLIRVQTRASVEGTSHKPIMTWDDLRDIHDVFVLTGCTSGVVGKPLQHGKQDKVEENVRHLIEIFGKHRVYLEVQGHNGWEMQRRLNEECLRLAAKYELPLAAAGDIHYVHQSDWEVQDVMLAIRDNVAVDYPSRMRYDVHDLHLRDAAEILEDLQRTGIPKAVAEVACINTLLIAQTCNVEIPVGKNVLPVPKVPTGMTPQSFFEALTEDGLRARLPDKASDPAYRERIQYELHLYTAKGFVDYMLIVWELMQWSKSVGITTGPGRGSVSGSLVAYCLGITDVDPILHDIIMERFISEVRTDMPDIDLDFEDDRREDVISHLKEMYGKDNVAKLGTEIRSKGRLVLRDVGRVLGIPKEEVDPVSSVIIYRSGGDSRADYTIEDSFQQFEVCKRFDRRYPKVKRYAVQLEGRVRNYGTHASGVLITPWPVTENVPMERRGREITSAWTMEDVEYLGLLKLDILGITGLNMVHTCLDLVEKRTGAKLDLSQIPLDDKLTLEAFGHRETSGIFQFGSLGLRQLCERMYKAKKGSITFDDLVALNTLHRPAMLGMGLHREYIYRVEGTRPVVFEHPVQELHLKHTYGIAMYQEQIMMICHDLGGLTWEHVGLIRKVISKRQGQEEFSKARDIFVSGAVQNGCDAEVASRIFTSISHAGCVAGSTEVGVVSANKTHGTKRTIRELYEKRQHWRTRHRPLLFSMYDDGRLHPNELVAAVYAGEQRTYTVRTKSGHTIRATKDHFFLTPDGMQPLYDLKLGSYVCVSDYQRPKRNWKKTGRGPGRWGEGDWAHRGRNKWAPTARLAYWRKRMLAEIGRCERCSSQRHLLIHHKNEDHEYNRRENLLMLCRSCHQKQHRKSMRRYTIGYDTYFTTIVSIKLHGMEPTYDIAMAKPPHDYVANGFVVHNSYAFNKAHAVSYTMLAYRQMWLKVHYPLEYHAALLICETAEELKPEYVRSARRFNIPVLPPDINRSDSGYSIHGDAILCGLSSIDNVGVAAAADIVKKRKKPYADLADFVMRIDRRLVHTRVVEQLINAGAFKSLHPNTKAMLTVWKAVMQEALKEGLTTGRQRTLGGDMAFIPTVRDKLRLTALEDEFSPQEEAKLMRSVLRFPSEEHPMSTFSKALSVINPSSGLKPIHELNIDHGEDNATIAGIVTMHNWKIEGLEGGAFRDVDERSDMEGHKYVHLNVEDASDFILAHFGTHLYNKHKEILERPDGYPIVCEGFVRQGISKLIVCNFTVLTDWNERLSKGESLTAFEQRLLRHPMEEMAADKGPTAFELNGIKRLWQLPELWGLGLRVRLLGLPIWTHEKPKVWYVCLQDIHDGKPVSQKVLAWPDAFTKYGDELRSTVPLILDAVPLEEPNEWAISLRAGCKVQYASEA